VDQITVIYAKFLLDVACQKLLKSANISRSYSQNKSGFLFFGTRCIYATSMQYNVLWRPMIESCCWLQIKTIWTNWFWKVI